MESSRLEIYCVSSEKNLTKGTVDRFSKRQCYKILNVKNPNNEGLLTKADFKTHLEALSVKDCQRIYGMTFKINNTTMIRHLNDQGVNGTSGLTTEQLALKSEDLVKKLCIKKLKLLYENKKKNKKKNKKEMMKRTKRKTNTTTVDLKYLYSSCKFP